MSESDYAYSHRVRNPLRILLALWRVTRDIKNTHEAAIVEIAFARSRLGRRFARWDRVIEDMSRDPQVAQAFRERRRLGWLDVDRLATLPEGTLGRIFAMHLEANALDPNLVDIPVEDDASYLLAHLFETHDIWHVVSGCGTDEAGEFAIGGFYAAQTGAPFFAFLLGLVFLNTAFVKPGQLRSRTEGLAKGYLAGQRARPLFGTDWCALWDVPIETVRKDLGLDPSPLYPGQGIQQAAQAGPASFIRTRYHPLSPRPALALFLSAPLALGLVASSAAQEDAAPAGLREGEVIRYDQIARLRPYLPPELWPHREFVFYEGMQLEIGPPFRDYSPAPVYQEATERHRGTASIGPDGSLRGYVAGQPFPMDEIDCQADPHAGAKIIWNFDYRWQGGGPTGHAYYSYWDRGEELPLYYEATARIIGLAHRPEPQYAKNGGDVFREEKRKLAYGVEVLAPFDAKGIAILSYRYKSADAPRSQAKNDDTWVYVPTLRRVRRISSAQRTDAVSGTDFTFDDFSGFFGIPPQYEWTCLGQQELLATVNSKVRAYPYTRDHNFGPYGLSFASDRWELRRALKIQFVPKNDDHPYSRKTLYIDENSAEALYAFAYDRKNELWKIIYHNKRWSEDGHEFYEPWDGVPEPRDSVSVADVVINVQTGTGNRIEFWDTHGTPLRSKGRLRRYIDVGRLTKGR